VFSLFHGRANDLRKMFTSSILVPLYGRQNSARCSLLFHRGSEEYSVFSLLARGWGSTPSLCSPVLEFIQGLFQGALQIFTSVDSLVQVFLASPFPSLLNSRRRSTCFSLCPYFLNHLLFAIKRSLSFSCNFIHFMPFF